MYRYLLFEFDPFESSGGIEDLALKFNTFDEFINDYDYKDLYYKQLVDTIDYSMKEFTTSITYRFGTDDYSVIKKQREEEFINWIASQL